MSTKLNMKSLAGAAALVSVALLSAPSNAATVSLGLVAIPGVAFPTTTLEQQYTTNGTVTDYYTFSLGGEYIFFAGDQVSGSFGFVKSGSLALYSGVPTGGSLIPELTGSNPNVTPAFNSGNYSWGLGDDTGWKLGPGKYYLEATINAKGVSAITGSIDLLAVPEPTTWAMLGIGFAGIGLVGLSKRRNGSRYAVL